MGLCGLDLDFLCPESDAPFLDKVQGVIMTKIRVVTVMVAIAAWGLFPCSGCDVVGPWKRKGNPVRIDQHGRPIPEQEMLRRERLAVPMPNSGPTTEFERPGVHGR